MDDLEAEMGRSLEEIIASLPKEQQDEIEARYQVLRGEYLSSLQDGHKASAVDTTDFADVVSASASRLTGHRQ